MKEKVVFILGAGFSKPAGAPLVDGFLKEARDIYANENDSLEKNEKDFFSKVFKYHGDLAKARTRTKFDIDNIEDFFSILDINIASSKESALKEIRKALVYVIIKTLEQLIDQDRYSLYYKFLQDLCGLQEQYQYSFITFNYDLILERSLENGACSYNYCLHPDEFPIESIQKKILKLHGSSNWLFCSQCSKITILNQKALGNLYSQKCNSCGLGVVPLLIPPTWNKRFDSVFIENVWHFAFEELRQANRIIIIGYSLPPTDIYFRDFLTLCLKDSDPLKRIVVIDPNKSIKERYESFFETDFSRRYLNFIARSFSERSAGNGITAKEMIEGEIDGAIDGF